MNNIQPSAQVRSTAGGAFFLSVFVLLVALVLDHAEPRPGTPYLLAFGAAAVLVNLTRWWTAGQAGKNAGVAFFLSVFMFVVVMVLDHAEPRPGTPYLLAAAAFAALATLLCWWWAAILAAGRSGH